DRVQHLRGGSLQGAVNDALETELLGAELLSAELRGADEAALRVADRLAEEAGRLDRLRNELRGEAADRVDRVAPLLLIDGGAEAHRRVHPEAGGVPPEPLLGNAVRAVGVGGRPSHGIRR